MKTGTSLSEKDIRGHTLMIHFRDVLRMCAEWCALIEDGTLGLGAFSGLLGGSGVLVRRLITPVIHMLSLVPPSVAY